MLTIWGRLSSFNPQKVMWLADELGLVSTHPRRRYIRRLGHGALPGDEPARADPGDARRGGDRVGIACDPALSRGARRRGRFWPEGPPPARWPIVGWIGRRPRCNPIFSTACFGVSIERRRRSAIGRRDSQNVARCAEDFRKLERLLADRRFLCGDELTLADIPAGTALYRYFEIDIERPSVPNVEAWYRRLPDRPAYRQRVMVPFDELRGRLDP